MFRCSDIALFLIQHQWAVVETDVGKACTVPTFRCNTSFWLAQGFDKYPKHMQVEYKCPRAKLTQVASTKVS